MPRYRRTVWPNVLVLLVVLAIVAARYWIEESHPHAPAPLPRTPNAARLPSSRPPALRAGALPPGEYAVDRVVDGDTLILHTRLGAVRVRLQGLNTPETVKEDSPVEQWGPEATRFTKEFVARARGRVTVHVEGEPRDKFDRYLVFIYNGDELLNEQLIRAGLAHAKLGYDYSQPMKDLFRHAQREAQRNNRGVWSQSNSSSPLPPLERR
jgi:micrococcal nuclease